MDPTVVEAAVDEVGQVLRADGGDLILVAVEPKKDRIHLRVDLAGVSCLDCILPPNALKDVIASALARQVTSEFELVVDDPRRVSSS